ASLLIRVGARQHSGRWTTFEIATGGNQMRLHDIHVRTAFVLAIALLSMEGGCAHLTEKLAKQQNTTILNPDSVQGTRDSRDLPGTPRDPLDAAANKFRGGNQPRAINAVTDCASKTDDAEDHTFFCEQQKSQADPTDPSAAKAYLETGLTLSNELCNA